ncbi:MAG: hypothetical protein L0Z53_06370, partial [Acidobacteriales bacterium]|nr:hypothetical protein [Terriglobales bacterium]
MAVDPLDITRRKTMPLDATHEDLLAPVFRRGRQVYELPAITHLRKRTGDQLRKFHSGIRRLVNPHEYPVGLEMSLHELRTNLVLAARGFLNTPKPRGEE